MLKIGQTAPDFQLRDQHGNDVHLSNLVRNGDLILYFYPADFSPGCTAEACVFRDQYAGIQEAGVQIVGVSPQGVGSHDRFARTFGIPFPLLSDPGSKVIRRYGVAGPLGFGVRRVTFLIDEDRVVRNRIIADINIQSHARLIRATVEKRSHVGQAAL